MRVLMVHNHYQQLGGEDQIFADEVALLESHGHQVIRYTAHNDHLENQSSVSVAKNTLWNSVIYRELQALIRREQPSIAHFHNTFPIISPAAYYAARAERVPVVQTLHNYRLLCPNALFFRDGGVCEDCLGKRVPWPGVVHACYRESRAASGVVAAMLTVHRALRTWSETVDVYIAALTEFARQKFIQGGLPAEKIVVKPNFIPDPGQRDGQGGYALFVGRLSPEKGVDTLLAAWRRLGGKVPLKIVGDGPLASKVSETARQLPEVQWLGRRRSEEVYDLMGRASFLVFPSTWYEGLPRTIIESFAVGTPIVASNLGAMSSVVNHGRTGLHFRPGNPEDLAAKVGWAFTHPAELARMRREARAEFEAEYTAERNYQMLMEIYDRAIKYAREKR